MEANIVSNDGAFAMVEPLTLPIFGKYNDYGCLEEIEENAYTKYLEEKFEMSIYSFMEIICRGSCHDGRELNEKNGKKFKHLCGMFVLRDVWDKYVKVGMEKMGYTTYQCAELNTNTLEMIGFKFKGKDKDRERYNQKYVHPSSDTVTIYSDGTWIRIESGDKEINSCYSLKDLEKIWETETGKKLDLEHLKSEKANLRLASLMSKALKANDKKLNKLENILTKLKEDRDNYDDEEYKAKVRDAVWAIQDIRDMRDTFGGEHSVPKDRYWGKTFMKINSDIIKSKPKSIQNMMADYMIVKSIMYRTNKLIRPSFTGPQCGDEKADYLVSQLEANIAKERYMKWREEMDYDNDEDLNEF
jgi:hypothetical protein